MPYKNIVFVKLEKRLLNDPRWWSMSEPAQLLYVKLILLAAETYNKICLQNVILREALRSRIPQEEFDKCIEEIEKNFPKFKKNKYVRYFAEFDTKTNYIPKGEIPRKSQGLPKVVTDKDKEEDKDIDKEKEKDKEKKQASPALQAALDKVYKNGLNIYALINRLKKELEWGPGQEFPEEVIFKVCSTYEKGQVKDEWAWFTVALKKASEDYQAQKNIKEGQEWKDSGSAETLKSIIAGIGGKNEY